MGLVTKITKNITIPVEGVDVVIRKLSHVELRAAAKKRQSEGVGFMRELGGELLKALRDADSSRIQKIQDAQEAVLSNYDRDVLLKTGIVSWGYEAKLPNATDDLDEPTAKFLAEAIFEFSRPETKEEVKNE